MYKITISSENGKIELEHKTKDFAIIFEEKEHYRCQMYTTKKNSVTILQKLLIAVSNFTRSPIDIVIKQISNFTQVIKEKNILH
jgi:hypothetical protein